MIGIYCLKTNYFQITTKYFRSEGLGIEFCVECFPIMCQALGSSSSRRKGGKEEKRREGPESLHSYLLLF